MADRMVRIFVTAETAAAIAKLEEVGATSDEIAAQSSAAMDESAASTDAAGSSFSLAGLKATAMANPWITAGLAVGAVAVGVGVYAVNMADKFDKATDSLAADAGISTKSAKKISDSFLDAGNSTIYDATAITSAYAGVAAQLGSVEGHALDAAQAQQVMNAAQNLATATGGDLATTTSSLATVMQVYGQKSTAAAGDSNILFNAARLVGGGVGTVTASVQKLVAGLGVAAPPLKDVGGLLEDLATHGETGRKAISAVTSGFAALIKTSLGVTVAQRNMATDMGGLTGPALALAQQLEAGTISSYNYGRAVEALGGQQGSLATAFGSAYSAEATAQVKITDLGITVDNTAGKFVGIGSVISQLHAIYLAHGADAAMAAATDALGATAADKLTKTIEAGPAAYNDDVAAVVKSNAAHAAAQKQLQNLGDQFDEAKTDVENMAIKLGEVLMPALMDVAKVAFPALVEGIKIAVAIITPIIEALVDVIEGIVTAVQRVVGFFQMMAPAIGTAISGLESVIVAPFKDAFDMIAEAWNATLGSFKMTVPSIGIGPFHTPSFSLGFPKIPVFDTGGLVTSTGVAWVAAGEQVLPASAGGSAGAGTVNIYVTSNDGQAVVNALKQYQQSHGSIPIRVSGH